MAYPDQAYPDRLLLHYEEEIEREAYFVELARAFPEPDQKAELPPGKTARPGLKPVLQPVRRRRSRGRGMFGARLIMALMLAAAAVSAEPVQLPLIPECESCTARHMSLQRLQDARVPPPAETEPASQPGSDAAGVILPVIPSAPSLAVPCDLSE